MSLDLTAPDFSGQEIRYLPLALVRKHVFRDFDVRDEHNCPLPVLTREQNGPIAAAILIGNAEQALEKDVTLPANERALTRAMRSDLKRVVGITPAPAVATTAYERLLKPGPSVADANRRRALASDQTLAGEIRELFEQFILLVDVRLKPGDRRIIKYSYEDMLQSRNYRPTRRLLRLLGWAVRSVSFLLETVGILTYRTRLSAQGAFDGASYHVDVEAPEEVFFARARLLLRNESASLWERLWGSNVKTINQEFGVEKAHLYVFRLAPRESDRAIVDLKLSMRPGGLLLATFLSSALTTVILWVGVYLHNRGVTAHRTEATALLVVLPAAFAALLIPKEHPLTRRMFAGLRALIVVTAVIAFAAGGLLAANVGNAPRIDLWFVHLGRLTTVRGWRDLGYASLGITALVGLSLALAWWRRYAQFWRRYVPWRRRYVLSL
jgi:hypothetical protein